MQGKKILTWIIPVYNGEKYLGQAIESILRQPCQDFEILVVDDGSTDDSLNIAQSYVNCGGVRVIHQENGGVSSARNLGIRNVRTEYVAFLDADDVVCKGAFDDQIKSVLETGQYDLLSFSYYCGDQNLRYGNRKQVKAGEVEPDETKLDPFKHFCSFVYHRLLLEGETAAQFPEGIKIREDVAFLFLAYRNAKRMCNIERNWFVYRNNISSALHQLKNYEHMIQSVLPAWYWCKGQCKDNTVRSYCDTWIFAEAAEYIQTSCMAGTPVKTIQAALESPIFREALANYDILWNSRKAIYESFMENPGKYWRKQRCRGIAYNAAKAVSRLPLIRQLYFKRKYKENIGSIV